MDMHALARRIAAESMVLMKNEGKLLPLPDGCRIAFFGRTQVCTLYSGNGSGATASRDTRSVLYACEAAGLVPAPKLKAWYEAQYAEEMKHPQPGIDWTNAWELVHSGVMYEVFGRYHAPVPEYLPDKARIEDARAFADIAVVTLGRNAGGEECDRHLAGDYLLTDTEKELLTRVCRAFGNVVLILNVNGVIDLAWTDDMPSVRSVLFMGIPGEAGAEALADLLLGKASPCGKLAMTWARRYEDYPSAAHFSYDKERPETLRTYESYGLSAQANGSVGYERSPVTVYAEGLCMGYRGFDAFGMTPLYPFGFGLTYTRFDLQTIKVEKSSDGVSLTVSVRNTGDVPGREVAQAYLSFYGCESDRPVRELAGFEKTGLLLPGETQLLTFAVPWRAFACYHEESASWRVEQGCYVLCVGNSSRHTAPAAHVTVPGTLLVEQCTNLLSIKACNKDKLVFHTAPIPGLNDAPACPWHLSLTRDDIPIVMPQTPLKTEIPQVVRDMSVRELAALCVGYGPGTPFSAFGDGTEPATISDEQGVPLTQNNHPTGMTGYVSPAMPQKQIDSMAYRDGPAGTGGVAWPTEMLLACAFDRELWAAFGDAAGAECEAFGVDIWLAPAVNLQRHPLCGRNFEYFSEDPYLTGACASAVARGAQKNHRVKVCPKHFAMNEQETFRRGSARKHYDAVDSILPERVARELYLRPFEMLVREAEIACIMTSFNKINGVFAGGSRDLCTRLLRDEWRFHGVVVTDWGDMDTMVDGADAVAAGNDVIMPGGPPVITQILKGFEEGRVSRNALEKAVAHLVFTLHAVRQ